MSIDTTAGERRVPCQGGECLDDMWRGLRDGYSPLALSFVRGAITALYQVGILTDEQDELWRHRIETCPGHDDEGGRDWCAYGCAVREQEPAPPKGQS